VLIGTIAQNVIKESYYLKFVALLLLYAHNVLDKNHSVLLPVNKATTGNVTKSDGITKISSDNACACKA
jgi:hypothetical protein